ncbi:MAG: alpha/beta hydrolase [Lachnospiraceae bacterium]|nr:alpha/beta hydrolase [Lachnospiraceae bacterium]
MKTTIFPDNTFVKHMDDEVAEWQRHCLKSRFFNSFDGAELSARFAVNPESIGSVIFVHGFTEFTEKYTEMLYYFYNEGYSVFMYDQRGHGHSARFVEEDYLVHIDTFDTYVKDLDFFISRLVLHETPGGPFYLFAHSMGGCIAALYLEHRPDFFRKAILSSPMLRMTFGSIPTFAGKAMATAAKLINREESPVPAPSLSAQRLISRQVLRPASRGSCGSTASRSRQAPTRTLRRRMGG